MASVVASKATATLWSKLGSVPAKYPFAFGVAFSGVKTSCSDLLVQTVVEQREKIDWKRNAAFAAFGFIYLGGVQYTIYVPIFSRLFPGAAAFAAKPIRDKMKDAKGLFQLCAQVFLDQCVHHPFMYFPAFYCTRELVMSDKPDIKQCLQTYRANLTEDLQALWKIWVPATFVNFAFMPMYARIPFVACVSLLWTCVLSAMRGGDVAHAEDMAGGAVTGSTLVMMEEGLGELFTSPVELDPSKDHIMLTASGRDKPGWVALLTAEIAALGGNVTHSKMTRLGQEFIIVMHVAVEPGMRGKLVKTLRKNSELKPLNIQCSGITRRATGTYDEAVMGVRVRCQGPDKPGMLASISGSLNEVGLSVESLTTELQRHSSHSSDGRVDFVVTADCVACKHMEKDQIDSMVHKLEAIKKSLDLDVVDIRVQRLQANRD